jgi:hypothetical protein
MSLWASFDRPREARPASSANGCKRKRGIWRDERARPPFPATLVGRGVGCWKQVEGIVNVVHAACAALSKVDTK